MGSIVHRSVPTNLKWFPNCSHAHALFQDRFKDVQVGSRWFSTLYILSPNFHTPSWTVVLYTEVPFSYTEAKVCNILRLPSSHVLRKQRRKRQNYNRYTSPNQKHKTHAYINTSTLNSSVNITYKQTAAHRVKNRKC